MCDDIPGSRPRWHLPARTKIDTSAKVDHIGRNFGDFLSVEELPRHYFGSIKRHFEPRSSEESAWKPSMRIVSPQRHQERHSGKKMFPDAMRASGPREAVPRGKKIIPQGGHQVFAEKEIVAKHKVIASGGTMAAQQRSGDYAIDDVMARKRSVDDPRGGIPSAKPGDKPYAHPEASGAYFQSSSREHSGGAASSMVPLATKGSGQGTLFSDRVRQEEKTAELNDVRGLDSWKPAQR